MSIFSKLFGRKPKTVSQEANRAKLSLEKLEDRCMPSCNLISGYVYQDANSNGLFDPGELPIANSNIQLRNAQNQVVGTTTTNAQGFYEFEHDATISQTLTSTAPQTINFPTTQTDFTLTGLVGQFDPALGELQSVEITHNGSITSEIRVENTSPGSTSTITGTVGGSLTLTAPGVNSVLTLQEIAGTFSATKYDNVKDYAGTSGTSFGAKTASGIKTFTLTGAGLSAYIGTGQVTFTENAQAASYASGGGNLDVTLHSTGASTVSIVYKYIPNNCLKPGNYTIIQVNQPPGFFDGKESSGGVVLNTPPGSDSIPVVLNTADLINNNFGELSGAGLSGHVYHDADNDGVKDAGESAIVGALITLSGAASKTAVTDQNGFYQFLDLAPGTYTLKETQPGGYFDGKDTAGTVNGQTLGAVSNDQIANIVLPAGAKSINNNFGELKPASLAGYVYADSNNNGVKQAGEAGIAGVQVTLTGQDDQGQVSKTAVTDQSGFYRFLDLRPGTYAINESQPSTYFDGKDAIGSQGGTTGNDLLSGIALKSGVDGVNNNFGELKPASLSGFVYADANNNGVKQQGELGISGVQVTLTGQDDLGGVSKTAVTDQNGFYEFEGLRPGNYAISESQPSGYFDGKDAIGSQGGTTGNDFLSGIALPAGVDGVNNNFGEFKSASLAGFVYADDNNNGVKEQGEAGISGTQVTLTGQDDLGAVNKTAFTDGSGFYQFQNLRPGTYTITETQPSTHLDGKDAIGSQGGTTGNDLLNNIALQSGVNGINNNFGELKPASVSGHVYADANNDGTKQPGELGIAGTQVTLTGQDDRGSVTKTAVTDGNGFYQFQNLRPGTYTITETQPSGYFDGKDTIGSQGGATGNDVFSNILLESGVSGVNNNFGELKAVGLSGYVYADTNNNGLKQQGELGISGVQLTLTGQDDFGQVTKTAFTDQNGFYQFAGLHPGTYTITETQPTNYFDGKDAIGSQGGVTGNDLLSSIVLPSGVDGINNNFGELKGSSLSGYVYSDTNNNGLKQQGEQPIGGVQVTLTGQDDLGQVNKTAFTDQNGFYQFQNVRPGTYTIAETQPSGYFDGKDAIGSQGGTTANDLLSNIALPSGVDGTNNNFGELKAASLSGFVYADSNNDGVKQQSEAGISGVQVTLTGQDDLGQVNKTAVTDQNGFYQFLSLRPGSYAVSESQPSGFFDGKDTIGSQGGFASNDLFSNIVLQSGVDGVNNNFGELKSAGLSGFVYADSNNNGVKEQGELGISGVQITLNGQDDLGPVNKTAITDANGFYQFQNLRPGTYAISEAQPSGYFDGKDSIGSQGGTAGNDLLSNIVLPAGTLGTNNNFGEFKAASLSGYVYQDKNDNGIKEAGELGIAGTTITLTGFDDQGPLVKTITTDGAGFYQFLNLRPGTYALSESQPDGFNDGKDTVGTQGGATSNDNFNAIVLASGVVGLNNNFGEIIPANSDLGIVKSVSPTSVLVGTNLSYTLTITNYGTHVADNVKVDDTLPPGVTLVNVTGTGWTFVQGLGTFSATRPSLAVGASAQIFVTIKAPNTPGTLVNTATVTSTTPDKNPNNNSSTATATVFNQPGTVIPKTITPLQTKILGVPVGPPRGKGDWIGNPVGQAGQAGAAETLEVKQQKAFIDGVYRTLLGRASTAAEQTAGVAQFKNGITRDMFVASVWNSPAHRTQQAVSFYKTYLGRTPTAGESASLVAQLSAGESELNVALMLLTSPQYQQLHPTPSSMVAGLHKDILGRTPDASGQLLMAEALGTQSVNSIADDMLRSADGLANLIDNAYRAVLRRPATAADVQFWSPQLQSNQVTPGDIRQQLLASSEFFSLAYASAT